MRKLDKFGCMKKLLLMSPRHLVHCLVVVYRKVDEDPRLI